MTVTVAKSAGFCFGVKRAVDMAYAKVGEKHVYTYGPIIHNESVVEDLSNKGVLVLNNVEDIKNAEPGIVIIRAHGIPKELYQTIREAGHEIVDATCPFVLKIQKIVRDAVSEGSHVIIIGDRNHPEIQGIKSCGGDGCTVLDTKEEAEAFMKNNTHLYEKLVIVAQTTFNFKKFQELVEIFNKNLYHKVDVLNTICNATQERQEETAKLAVLMDAMIVIGGKNSSNSQKLYDICRADCANTFFIQSADELDYSLLRGLDKIGITAGASTPEKIIKEVQTKCQI